MANVEGVVCQLAVVLRREGFMRSPIAIQRLGLVAVLWSLVAKAQIISTIAGNSVPLVNGPGLGQLIESTLGRIATD